MSLILIIIGLTLLLASMLFGIFNISTSLEEEPEKIFKNHGIAMAGALIGSTILSIGVIWWIVEFIRSLI